MRRPAPAVLLRAVLLWTGLLAAGCGSGAEPVAVPSGPPSGGPSSATRSPAVEPPASAQVPASLRRIRKYVALGDSYTAAPGVPSADPASRSCFRSDGNYPALVAAALPNAELTDVSCGSAATGHATGRQRTIDGFVPPQVRAVTRDTDLVTIGLGGNDQQVFGMLVGYCPNVRARDPQGAPCREEVGERLFTALAELPGRLVGVVEAVRERAPDAEVLLVGYPRIVPHDDVCPDLLPLARGDYAYVREVGERLNAAIEQAAREAGVGYVDVAAASQGHDVCATEPWVNGAVTAPDAQVYHPFPAHQEAVAELVLGQLAQD